MSWILLLSVFVIATCGLIYELIAGTLASYLLGDTVTQFSTIIGTYLFSMGVGSWVSKYFNKNLISSFIRIEIIIGLIGGFSAALLFLVFAWADSFRIALYGTVALTGILVGLEIPLLMRIMKDQFEFKDLVSRIFTFDYIGALAASILFPLILVPQLGLVRTSFFFGMLNVGVALLALQMFRKQLKNSRMLFSFGSLALALLIAGFAFSDQFVRYSEEKDYPGSIVYARSTPYQRIVLTRSGTEMRLYLNGNLQFSSQDEYRYHEALVHPAMISHPNPKRVLILGGGDGLALREVLKYPQVDSVYLVDLDPEITRLFSNHDGLKQLNGQSLFSPKLTLINNDAFTWIRANKQLFDVAIVDFPDPSNFSLGKLYSSLFYRHLYKTLSANGLCVIQSTSPLVAPKSYWCINRTLQEARFATLPYHCYVPSFGEWGFSMGTKQSLSAPTPFPKGLKYLSDATLQQMRHFPRDMHPEYIDQVEVNRLNNQSLVHYFEEEWSRYE